MRYRLSKLVVAVALSLAAVSCDDLGLSGSAVVLSLSLPGGNSGDSIASATALFENVSNGFKKTIELVGGAASETLDDGLYNVNVEGVAVQNINGAVSEYSFRAQRQNVVVSGGSVDLSDLAVSPVRGGTGFMFAEIMLCSALPEGATSYRGDTYFRIVNSSSDTLCADGLCIVESKFKTVTKQDYQPDYMAQAVTADVVYQIPLGDGRSLPVAPGQSLLIADVAKDHRGTNPNSFDLSVADFEWYDETEQDKDVDVPEVPNMLKVYSYSKTIWQPNMQGNTAFALGYIGGEPFGVSNEDYIREYGYGYKYMFVFGDIQKEMSNNAYLFPNVWVCDAVVFGPSSTYVWNVIDQSLDAGYVSIGETGSDANRRGRAARRKYDSATGQFIDTNNSSDDFEVVAANPFHEFR